MMPAASMSSHRTYSETEKRIPIESNHENSNKRVSVMLSEAKHLRGGDPSPSTRLRMTAAILLLVASTVFAADAPQAVTVIHAARLIDGRGGAVVAPAVVV